MIPEIGKIWLDNRCSLIILAQGWRRMLSQTNLTFCSVILHSLTASLNSPLIHFPPWNGISLGHLSQAPGGHQRWSAVQGYCQHLTTNCLLSLWLGGGLCDGYDCTCVESQCKWPGCCLQIDDAGGFCCLCLILEALLLQTSARAISNTLAPNINRTHLQSEIDWLSVRKKSHDMYWCFYFQFKSLQPRLSAFLSFFAVKTHCWLFILDFHC